MKIAKFIEVCNVKYSGFFFYFKGIVDLREIRVVGLQNFSSIPTKTVYLLHIIKLCTVLNLLKLFRKNVLSKDFKKQDNVWIDLYLYGLSASISRRATVTVLQL